MQRTTRALISSILLTSIAYPGTTDDPAVVHQPLMSEGTILPGLGTLTTVSRFSVNDHGDWVAGVYVETTSDSAKLVVLRNGTPVFVEGDPIAAIPGASVQNTFSVDIDNDGDVGSAIRLSGTSSYLDDHIFWVEGEVLLQEGDPIVGPGVSPGTFWHQLDRISMSDHQLLVTAELDDPLIPGEYNDALVRLSLNVDNTLANAAVLAIQGSPVSLTSPDTVGTLSEVEFQINAFGDALFLAWIGSVNETKPTLVLNQDIVGRAGHPSVIPGEDWWGSPRLVDLNDEGLVCYQWAAGSLEGTVDVLVKGEHPYAIEGDVTSITSPFGIGAFVSADVNNRDDLVWRGDWDLYSGSSFFHEECYFLNRKPIARKDETVVGGKQLTELGGIVTSDNGRYLLYNAYTSSYKDVLVLVDLGPWLELGGELAGSTTPQLVGIGSLATGTPITVRIDDGPPSATGALVFGLSTINAPFLGTTLVPSPDAVIPISLDGEGSLELRATWPAGLPSGSTVFMQAFLADPVAPQGYAATDAVVGTTP